jgi:hypothetical protein
MQHESLSIDMTDPASVGSAILKIVDHINAVHAYVDVACVAIGILVDVGVRRSADGRGTPDQRNDRCLRRTADAERSFAPELSWTIRMAWPNTRGP